MDSQCRGCPEDESKIECPALLCVRKKGYESCFDCPRVNICKKRRRSLENCLIIKPRTEFPPGAVYLISSSWKDAFLKFQQLTFSEGPGLMITDITPSVLGNFTTLNVSNENTKGSFDPGDLDSILSASAKFVDENENSTIFITCLPALIEENTTENISDFVMKMNRVVFSSSSRTLIPTGELDPYQGNRISDVLSNSMIEGVVKAVSNPKRKDILDLLRKVGKGSFNYLYTTLGYTMAPKLSFHLRVLKEAGVIEQDEGGTYYISELGREIHKMLEKIGGMVHRAQKEEEKEGDAVIDDWDSKFHRYTSLLKRRGDGLTINVIHDIHDSITPVFGNRGSMDILKVCFTPYVEAERAVGKKELKRLISQVAFVFMVEQIPLTDAVDWADSLITKHGLK
jgi:DNA-binding transcriptional ArsR family regulator